MVEYDTTTTFNVYTTSLMLLNKEKLTFVLYLTMAVSTSSNYSISKMCEEFLKMISTAESDEIPCQLSSSLPASKVEVELFFLWLVSCQKVGVFLWDWRSFGFCWLLSRFGFPSVRIWLWKSHLSQTCYSSLPGCKLQKHNYKAFW